MTHHELVIKDLQEGKWALGERIEALRAEILKHIEALRAEILKHIEALRAEILKGEREFSEARAEAKRETELFKRAVSEIVEFKKLSLWGHVQYWWRNR